MDIFNSKATKLTALVYNLDAPLPYSSVRRKLEIKRRLDVFRKAEIRRKQSERLKRKFKRRKTQTSLVRRRRAEGYAFIEKVRYYDSLEQSYWNYLKKKYGKGKILSPEEFEEHIAPRFIPGKSKIVRKDKSRKDFFLDNIEVVNEDTY
jgi:hypothetical protein